MNAVRLLSERELDIAGHQGRAIRAERHRRWYEFCRSKPPGHLAIIDVAARMGWSSNRLTDAELAAAGPGGRWLRRERERRARKLLLGALELRAALLRSLPMCHSSLWLYGVP